MEGIEKDQFTEKTTKLLIRTQLHLIKHITAKERQLDLYKGLESQELIDLAVNELQDLKADLQQLKNL